MKDFSEIKDAVRGIARPDRMYIKEMKVDDVALDTGCVKVRIQVADNYYYEMLSELTGTSIEGEYELIRTMKEMAALRKEYEGVKDAMESVKMKGYGVVSPRKEEIQLEEPVIIKQGNKYGVKIKSKSPSIHMIKANIETEIAPIVGTEQQAKDLITYIGESDARGESIWETNIFGKSIEQLVQDGIRSKLTMISEESQVKLRIPCRKS